MDSKFISQRVIDYDNQFPNHHNPTPAQARYSFVQSPASLAFGRTLEDLLIIDGQTEEDGYVPKVVIQLTEHIRNYGITNSIIDFYFI